MSPQRFAAAEPAFPIRSEDSDALRDEELRATGAGLAFTVLGAPDESVRITVVAPPRAAASAAVAEDDGLGLAATALAGKVVVVELILGASGEAAVVCAGSGCTASAR